MVKSWGIWKAEQKLSPWVKINNTVLRMFHSVAYTWYIMSIFELASQFFWKCLISSVSFQFSSHPAKNIFLQVKFYNGFDRNILPQIHLRIPCEFSQVHFLDYGNKCTLQQKLIRMCALFKAHLLSTEQICWIRKMFSNRIKKVCKKVICKFRKLRKLRK